MMEFYSSYTPIAKKPHTCEMRGGVINPGERYSYEAGKYDGDFFQRKLHLDCLSVLSDFCSEVDCEFTYDEILDWWRDKHCYRCKKFDDGECFEMTHVCWCKNFEPIEKGDTL